MYLRYILMICIFLCHQCDLYDLNVLCDLYDMYDLYVLCDLYDLYDLCDRSSSCCRMGAVQLHGMIGHVS